MDLMINTIDKNPLINDEVPTEEVEEVIGNNIPKNNNTLLISEKEKSVYLPYSEKEILQYLEQFPDKYSSFEDVVKREFIISIEYFNQRPILARFREVYTLIRDKESKSAFEALEMAIKIMFTSSLNPAIIAACKTQKQLENYLYCLEHDKLDDFNDFLILYRISPL